jgi:hypothetical protein
MVVEGRLVGILYPYLLCPGSFYLAWLDGSEDSPAVHAFVAVPRAIWESIVGNRFP